MKIGFPLPAALAFLALCLASGSQAAMAETRVSGAVRDASGNLIAHAYVEAIPVIAKNSGGTVGNFPNSWVAADSSGNFSLDLAPGRYRIRAKDEADGYPDPSFWVNVDAKAKFPEIVVGDKEIGGIEVVLGMQGGILAGELRDAQTHKPLASAKIRIQDARNSDAYVEVFTNRDGYFQYAVPSKPLLISAIAPGHKVTPFENGAEVTLFPGRRREFQLELKHE